MTGNPPSAWHTTSADESNARLQRPLPIEFSITVATGYQDLLTAELPGQGDCGRSKVRSLFRRPPAASAGACPLCQRSPNQPMLMAPAEVHTKSLVKARRRVEHRSRPGSSKLDLARVEAQSPKFLPNLPEKLVEDRSQRGRSKRESKPKVRVEARSACRNRILTLMSKQC